MGRVMGWWLLASLMLPATFIHVLAFGAEDSAESHFRRASQFVQQGKLDQAEREYRLGLKIRQAAQLLPDRVEPYQWLGRTLIQLGRVEEGRKQLAKVEQINARKRERAAKTPGQEVVPAQLGNPGTAQERY